MHDNDVILAVTPFGCPDVQLARALLRSCAFPILDTGRDVESAKRAIGQLDAAAERNFGVRISARTRSLSLPGRASVVVAPYPLETRQFRAEGRRVLTQVRSLQEARDAVAMGTDGLIVKGSESGGLVGTEPTFILLQRVLGEVEIPVWAQGGVGLHTAAAAVAGGAQGVVLDSQLALLSDCSLPESARAAISAMDGSETQVVAEHRVLGGPGTRLPSPDISKAAMEERLGMGEHTDDLIAVGQDGAFAKPLADRFPTAAELMQAVHRAIEGHIRHARALKPLGPDSALARSHKLRHPIAQGPMSSVSDRPAFARAVSDAGGLPFVALSLMGPDEARPILEETRALLEGRPWGVGLLGFVPPELHQQQRALLQDVRPPVALIAGGRPSQARHLEKAGIATYLHVPSPGLLDIFLKEGARRFVFEGHECGGHVGPRSSFVLWENAIERLCALDDAASLHLLFAGGIHDERSAAMVSVLASPLAARGAKIGVLLGTAYLFTEEALATGAISAEFQRAAKACTETALLETAPGHMTRAAPSEYIRFFGEKRRDLERELSDSQQVWAALEALNLGRLRIAAKGERLGDGVPQPVDEATQRREGLFMLGQVAALRGETTTLADLHRSVCERSSEFLDHVTIPEPPMADVQPVDIAVVGMAGIFPQSENLDAYWRNILLARNCITEVPDRRWNKSIYYNPRGTGDQTPSRWGGFIPEIVFEPAEFGIPPRSLACIDPSQLLSLLVAKHAFEDAGLDTRTGDRSRISVVFGATGGSELEGAYGFRSTYPQLLGDLPGELDAHLPDLTDDSFPGILINVIAGRIANRLDLGGVNFTTNAACASSLTAVDIACKELAMGSSDIVIAGGVDFHNAVHDYLMFASVRALSKADQCRVFDEQADGTILGEGVAALVLKRASDAVRDGDRIYAVIKSIGASSDGRSLGLTAPNKDGQTRALRRAYDRGRVSPADVELIEAHGTGTVVGDRAELSSLTEFMFDAGAERGRCTLGSVKSQIGHTKCTAGLAGLTKAVLAVYHGVLPATRNVETPNRYYEADTSPFVFRKNPVPWLSPVRRAGVSALGFGGTNFHAVVESVNRETEEMSVVDAWPAELLVFRGASRAEAQERVQKLRALLQGKSTYALKELAASVTQRDRREAPAQIAIVTESVDDLREKLATVAELKKSRAGVFLREADTPTGKLAFLFPGQGSQRVHMLAELFVLFPRLRFWLTRATDIAEHLFPRTAFSAEERAALKRAINDTRVAQPALGMADMAMADLLQGFGIEPDMVAGHSYGELPALAFADSVTRDELIDLSIRRAESILQALDDDRGMMAAVLAPADAVKGHLADCEDVVIANRNAPQQTVISGSKKGVIAIIEKLQANGMAAQSIPVSCAFHSPLVRRAAGLFAEHLERATIQAPRIPVYSNVTARPHENDSAEIRRALSSQIISPVRFEEQVRAMYEAGARIFVEVGPGNVLTGLVRRILGDQPHRVVVTDQLTVPSLRSLLEALARLVTWGVTVDTDVLFEGRDTDAFDLDAPPDRGPSRTAWVVDGQHARPAHGPIPASGLKPNLEPLSLKAKASAPPISADREDTVRQFIQSMREMNQSMQAMIETQRQFMLGYLGQAPESLPNGPPALDLELGSPQPPSLPVPEAEPQPVVQAIATPTTEAAPPERPIDILVAILSQRTGYPTEMLEPDLDLEADLGIDSIKRIEILSQLAERLGMKTDEEEREQLEELARIKTISGISEWLHAHLPALSTVPTQALPAGPPSPATSELDPIQTLLDLVSERTGYPVDMLEPDLDLEADLGIDSIKRAEILLRLNDRLSLWEGDVEDVRDELAEQLAGRKTIRSIGEWVFSRTKDAVHPMSPPGKPVAVETAPPEAETQTPDEIQRFALEVVPVTPGDGDSSSVRGRTFALTDDGHGIAKALMARLASSGAEAFMVAPTATPESIDGLVFLSALNESFDEPVKALFRVAQHAIAKNATWIVGATGLGGRFGRTGLAALPRAGVAGFLKSLSQEAPSMRVKAVDLNLGEPAERLAEQLFCELTTNDRMVEVGYDGGQRYALQPVRRDIEDGRPALEIGPDSVWLVTGGARGVTARVAIAVAKQFRCKLEIVDHSPEPERTESALTRTLDDAPAIRQALVREAGPHPPSPADIEAKCQQILRDREIRATFDAIGRVDSSWRYHTADVRDAERLTQVVDDIYARRGRLDGVIHGAGVIDDKLLKDKAPDSFDRVFDTKVKGAQTLVTRLRNDARFFVFFSSVSAVFGNRGQTDYAAANDQLDKLALYLAKNPSVRALSIDWGPWTGVGMVSDALERAYRTQGTELIRPEAGTQLCIDELQRGRAEQVILMAPSKGVERALAPTETRTAERSTSPSGPAPRREASRRPTDAGEQLPESGKGLKELATPNAKGQGPTASAGKLRSSSTRRMSLQTFPELIDHTFYRQRAGWQNLADLEPVVPMTGLVALMMEAAQKLRPDRTIVGIEKVQALHWLRAAEPIDVTVTCEQTSEDRISTTIEGYATGSAIVSDRYAPAPDEDRSPLQGERPSPVSALQLYQDRWMFHGPAYQGIKELGPIAEDGIRAKLEVGSALGALLDNAGQLFGFWVIANTEVDRLAMPVRIERVMFYEPHPPPGACMDCTVRVKKMDATTALADIALSRNGKPSIVLEGWQKLRFDVDEPLWDVLHWADVKLLSSPRPQGFVVFHDRYRSAVNRDLLTRRYLREEERRQAWMQGPKQQRSWVNGRVAAKDAVRHLLWSDRNGPIFPAEVWIADAGSGVPTVVEPGDQNLRVSIGHADDIAVALASRRHAVGIDIAAISNGKKDFGEDCFRPDELKLAQDTSFDGSLAGLWAAKRAFLKAKGIFSSEDAGVVRVVKGENEKYLVEDVWVSTVRYGKYVIGWTEF